jgi:hypothetical protein
MHEERRKTPGRGGPAFAALICCFLASAGAEPAWGQTPAQPALAAPEPTSPGPQSPSTPPPAAMPGHQPGFIDAFGRWIGDSVSNWNSGLKGAADAAKGAADAAGSVTRDTADAIVRFPGTRVVTARRQCPTAPNGAPDCRAAAEEICKANGFSSGSSIDFETSEKCQPIAFNQPRDAPRQCWLENFVTRALCQ